MSDAEGVVWLGVPLLDHKPSVVELENPLTSKIGGDCIPFRSTTAPPKAGSAGSGDFRCCPKCRRVDRVSLISQLYAPVGDNDRVLYVFVCSRCSAGQPACACFAVRSANLNTQYYAQRNSEAKAQAESSSQGPQKGDDHRGGDNAEGLFAEDDDWGGGDGNADDGWGGEEQGATDSSAKEGNAKPATGEAKPAQENAATETDTRVAHALAARGEQKPLPSMQANTFPCVLLDIVEEPEEDAHTADVALNEKVRAAHESGAVDMTEFEEDDETAPQKCFQGFMDRMERFPSQCIRWCENGEPLLCALLSSGEGTVPACGTCGAARRFEFQVMTPAIYFLTRHLKSDDDHPLHFGNILVYTCTADCDTQPYASEFCIVQKEI